MREKAPKHKIDLATPLFCCFLSTVQYVVQLCMFFVFRLPSPVSRSVCGSWVLLCVYVYYGDVKFGFQ